MHHALPVAVLLHLAAVAAAQESLPRPASTPWQQALAAAKAHKAPILVFVLPKADAAALPKQAKATREREQKVGMLAGKVDFAPAFRTARDVLLRQVQLLRVGSEARLRELPAPTEVQAILALSVPVLAEAVDCGARPGETVVIAGPDGKRLHGFAIDLLDREAFVRDVGGIVLAPAAVAARRANIAPALTKDLARRTEILEAKGADGTATVELQQVLDRLRDNLPAVAPAWVQHAAGKLEIARELAWFEHLRAPLGTRAVTLPDDPCPPCGMGYVPPQLMTVLHLIGP